MNKDLKIFRLSTGEGVFERDHELFRVNKVSFGHPLDVIFDQYYGKSMADVWPNDFYIPVDGTKPVDFVLCTSRIEAVSTQAKEVIENIAADDVEFLPLKLLVESKKNCFYDYWVLNALNIASNALDWDRTAWTQPEPPSRDDKTAYFSIIRPCLIEERVIGRHFFHIEVGGKIDVGNYVSNILKKALKNSGYSLGMHFSPIWTSHVTLE